MTRRTYEEPQATNPHCLTVKQHVFPAQSISRFAGPRGRVTVFDRMRQKEFPAKPDLILFCARRVWDQRAEEVYKRGVEDPFQCLAERLIADPGRGLTAEDETTAARFLALWYCRAACRHLPDGEFQLNAVRSQSRTKDEEERLERRWTGYVREGGGIPARQIYGVRLQLGIDDIEDQLKGRRWGVVTLEAGVELIVPDFPQEAVIPLSPSMCLACGTKSGTLGRSGARDLNNRIARGCREYFFYRTSPEMDADVQ